MDYAGLKAAVETSTGPRTDIPDHIYEITLSEINRDVRIKEMLTATTVAISDASSPTALAADFLEAEEVYHIDGQINRFYAPITKPSQTELRQEYERTYSITDDGITLTGAPNEAFTLQFLYYAANGALSGDTDVNPVLTKHPDLYLSLAICNAAKWKRNLEEAAVRRSEYEAALRRVNISNRRSRNPGVIKPRHRRVA